MIASYSKIFFFVSFDSNFDISSRVDTLLHYITMPVVHSTKSVASLCSNAKVTQARSTVFGSSSVFRSVTRGSTKPSRVGVSVRAAVEAPAPTMVPPAATEQAEKLLDIVFIATEVAPWSKTGGFVFAVGIVL